MLGGNVSLGLILTLVLFLPLYTGYFGHNTSYIKASYFWQDGPRLSPPTKMADV